MPTREELTETVLAAVHTVQEACGRDTGTVLASTDLLTEVAGFDSLNALEVLVQVSEDLGVNVPDSVITPRKSDGSAKRPLTVDILVDSILAYMEESADAEEPTGIPSSS